jgi:uncharacterized membrane protein YdbT with pleckstrin-like domain
MNTQDEKQVDSQTFIVRQSFKFFVLSIFGTQVVIILTLLLCIFAIGFLGPSSLIIISKSLLLTILIIALVIADLLVTVSLFLTWKQTYYVIRPNEIIIRGGIFEIKEKNFQLNQLETASVVQSLFGRIMDYGTIRLYTPLLEEKVMLFQIPTPNKYKDMVVQFSKQQQQTAPGGTRLIDFDPQITPDLG